MNNEAAIRILLNSNEYHHAKGDLPHSAASIEAFNKAIAALKAERPKGKWIFVNPLQADDPDDGGAYICSECKNGDWNIRGSENFCPNCGADMRGDKE